MKAKKILKSGGIILLVTAALVICLIPFIKTSGSNDSKIHLWVDLHGYRPTKLEIPTADEPTPINSTRYIATKFEEEYPDIKIEWAYTKPVGGMETEVTQWFTNQINAKTVPAIAFSWGTRYEDRDWYLPLDEYLDEPGSWPYKSEDWPFDTWRDVWGQPNDELQGKLNRGYLWNTKSTRDSNHQTVAIPITVYPGSTVGYYFNQDIFKEVGLVEKDEGGQIIGYKTPTTYEQLIDVSKTIFDKGKSKGYVGLIPWSFFTKKTTFDAWVYEYCVGPSFANEIIDEVDGIDPRFPEKDGHVNNIENAIAVLNGVYSSKGKNGALCKEMYRVLRRFYDEALEKEWDGKKDEYQNAWQKGTVGVREEGLWAIPDVNRTTSYGYGIFVAPSVSNDTSEYIKKPVKTKFGPYHPEADLTLNIMKPAVENNPKMLDAALKFLKFLSRPDMTSTICFENRGVLGAPLKTGFAKDLTSFISQDFPQTPDILWPAGFTSFNLEQMNYAFKDWLSNQISEEQFFEKVDLLQSTGAEDYLNQIYPDYFNSLGVK